MHSIINKYIVYVGSVIAARLSKYAIIGKLFTAINMPGKTIIKDFNNGPLNLNIALYPNEHKMTTQNNSSNKSRNTICQYFICQLIIKYSYIYYAKYNHY